MRRLLVPAAACLMTVACSGATEPPSWFGQREELPSCGIVDPDAEGYPQRAAFDCFQEAYAADRRAELTLVQYGDEGEYGRSHFRVLGGGRYEIVEQRFDSPVEGSDSSGWVRSECTGFVFEDDPGAQLRGAPSTNWAGECEQVEYVRD